MVSDRLELLLLGTLCVVNWLLVVLILLVR